MIGRHAPFAPVRQHARHFRYVFWCDKAAFVMTAFWPRVGEQQKRRPNTGAFQVVQQQTSVVHDDTNIVEALLVNIRQQTGYTVDEGFAADKANFWIELGQGRQMLASAKAYFQPNGFDGSIEQRSGIKGSGGKITRLNLQPRE